MIEFKDGMKFDTGGDYRIEQRSDGCYVVGHGMLVPVKDEEEGRALIRTMTERRKAVNT